MILIIVIVALLLIGAILMVYYIRKHSKEKYTQDELQIFINGMPKTALHMHIEGSLEPEMAFKFAQKYNMIPLKVPKATGGFFTVNTLDDLKKVYQFTDLESFLNVYNTLATTLRAKEDFKELAYAYALKAMSQNVKHAEIFFDPQTHTARGLSFEEVADGLNDGLEIARKKGLNIQIMCSFLRDHPVGTEMDIGDMKSKIGSNASPSNPTAWTTVKQAVQYNQATGLPGGSPSEKPPQYRLTSVALDNNEVGFPPRLFTKIYDFARQNGMVGVAHGGEEGPPEYIWECIDDLKCVRIDHAVRSIEDPALVSYMATPQNNSEMLQAYGMPHKLPATVCPLSNYKLKVFSDPTTTNIVEMLDLGIEATVNSDDPAYFGGYVTDNYMFLLTYLTPAKAKGRPIDLADVKRLCLNGFNASILPLSKKLAYIQEVNDYFLTNPGLLYNDFKQKYKF